MYTLRYSQSTQQIGTAQTEAIAFQMARAIYNSAPTRPIAIDYSDGTKTWQIGCVADIHTNHVPADPYVLKATCADGSVYLQRETHNEHRLHIRNVSVLLEQAEYVYTAFAEVSKVTIYNLYSGIALVSLGPKE